MFTTEPMPGVEPVAVLGNISSLAKTCDSSWRLQTQRFQHENGVDQEYLVVCFTPLPVCLSPPPFLYVTCWFDENFQIHVQLRMCTFVTKGSCYKMKNWKAYFQKLVENEYEDFLKHAYLYFSSCFVSVKSKTLTCIHYSNVKYYRYQCTLLYASFTVQYYIIYDVIIS